MVYLYLYLLTYSQVFRIAPFYILDNSAEDLFLTTVSKARHSIELLFNWLNEKTNIQRTMKIRSTFSLLVHTMGKIIIVLITLIFN